MGINSGASTVPGGTFRSASVRIIPPEFFTSSSVKNPAHPFRMVISGSPSMVPSNSKKNIQVFPVRINRSIRMSYRMVSPGRGRGRWKWIVASSSR